MKYYLVLVTGGSEYFLTPCVVVKAYDEESATDLIKSSNRAAYRRYSIALDRVCLEELPSLAELGAHLADCPEDIAYAF